MDLFVKTFITLSSRHSVATLPAPWTAVLTASGRSHGSGCSSNEILQHTPSLHQAWPSRLAEIKQTRSPNLHLS